MTLTLSGCSGSSSGATWSGSYVLSYYTGGTSTTSGTASAAACTRGQGGFGNLASGDQVLITSPGTGSTYNVTSTANSGTYSGYTTLINSYNAISSSLNSSGFNSAVSGGTLITCSSANCASRTVHLLGWHRVLQNASGTTVFNHSLNTSTPFTITGSAGSKQITAGTLVLQHNLAQYVATSTIATSLTFGTGCVPTGGSVTTTFSSGKSGSETITFSSTGVAMGSASITVPGCL